MSNENKLSTAPAGAVAQKTAGGGALSVFADGASFNTALRMAQCLASSTVVPKEYHGSIDPAHDPSKPFGWLRQFIGETMNVTEAMGNYTVRTQGNKVVLSSATSPETRSTALLRS